MSKIIIYQILVRLFGNRNTNNKFYGSLQENGCGKFDDITERALDEIKRMGITHVWYTGVIEHATMTDYSVFGISRDDPDVVKGKAGSPYAIKDYYDVDPDLARKPANRMQEFEALVERTHRAGLKVIIDFVPNHVARTYRSDAMPDVKSGLQANVGIKARNNLGDNDNTDIAFDPNNNFYYIIGQAFVVPQDYDAGGGNFHHPLKDKRFDEYPAKASGNDVFSATPSIDDWFETVKLNYGVDYASGEQFFDPIPDTWLKMLDILLFWADKNIDGWRCDMCEMPPVQFWQYAIARVKKHHPKILFIGEAYSPSSYNNLITAGFDCLYDKAGLYDLLRATVNGNAGFNRMQDYLRSPVAGVEQHMLAFLENHDEQRFASVQFAGTAEKAIPLMTLAATLHTAPVMIYFGQELGVTAAGATGFSGDDGRTSIFDYTFIPELCWWANGGAYDGGQLSAEKQALRNFYVKLLSICCKESAIAVGTFHDLAVDNYNSAGFNPYLNYAFARYDAHSGNRLIIFVSIDRQHSPNLTLRISRDLFPEMLPDADTEYVIDDILNGGASTTIRGTELFDKGLHIASQHAAIILKIG
ncbi:MAG: alpha-amylase family protein [Prevotellaceae bacterium]|jgi:glycosidase|nr:alpha-amylase family protein [Prevotellaceae bacterium]